MRNPKLHEVTIGISNTRFTEMLSGTLKADRSDSVMGASSYRMKAALVKSGGLLTGLVTT